MRSSRRTVIIAVLMIIVSLLSACYSDEAFTDIKNHPEKRVVSNKDGIQKVKEGQRKSRGIYLG